MQIIGCGIYLFVFGVWGWRVSVWGVFGVRVQGSGFGVWAYTTPPPPNPHRGAMVLATVQNVSFDWLHEYRNPCSTFVWCGVWGEDSEEV